MSSEAADATSSSDDDANDAVLALVGRWRVHAIADRAATRLQCERLGVNSDVFDVFAVPGATLKSCVVGVDVVAASSAAGAPMVAIYITANGISGEIARRSRITLGYQARGRCHRAVSRGQGVAFAGPALLTDDFVRAMPPRQGAPCSTKSKLQG